MMSREDSNQSTTLHHRILPHLRDKTTRTVVYLIAIFGFASLLMAGWIVRNRIFSPFTIDTKELESFNLTTETTNLDELKTKDTDQDGLTDYDEIYLYGTSPYIQDSDSDGLADAVEVKAGSDPNCSEGEQCTGIRLVAANTKLSDLLPQFSPTDESLKELTLNEFRKLLIDQGMTPTDVAAIPDEALLIAIDAIVSTDPPDELDISQLDDQAIRDFMIQAGLNEDEVNRIPPDELRELIKVLL